MAVRGRNRVKPKPAPRFRDIEIKDIEIRELLMTSDIAKSL